MTKEEYVVRLTPHYYYLGYPGEPNITIEIDKVRTIFGIPFKREQVFTECDRDLFKCISICNRYFRRLGERPENIYWPDFCKYITDYDKDD